MSKSHEEALRRIALDSVRRVSIKGGAISIRTNISQHALLFNSQAAADAAFEEWVAGNPEEARIRALLKESNDPNV